MTVTLDEIVQSLALVEFEGSEGTVTITAQVAPTLEGLDAYASVLRRQARHVQDIANRIGGNA